MYNDENKNAYHTQWQHKTDDTHPPESFLKIGNIDNQGYDTRNEAE
jgi:hypothetical protein